MASKTNGRNPRYTDNDCGGRQITGEEDEAVQVRPYDVSTYMIRHRQTLDARGFRTLRFVGLRRLFVDVPGVGVFKTSMYAWSERVRHWSGRRITVLP